MDGWYLIYSKSRQEQRAQENLSNQGFETFSPFIRLRKIRTGKAVTVTEPLFPRYIFLKCPEEPNLFTIRSTRGVAGLVRFGNELARVPTALVHTLLRNQLTMQEPTTHPFKKGDNLEILTGPFTSLNALFEQADGEHRSIILLNFLGQQLKLSVDNKELIKKM